MTVFACVFDEWCKHAWRAWPTAWPSWRESTEITWCNSCTAVLYLWLAPKQIYTYLNLHSRHMNRPHAIWRNFHAYSKNDPEKSHTWLNFYEDLIWPKFEQVSQKVTTPQTLGLSAFDTLSTFDTSASKCSIKRSSPCNVFESRSIKSG